MQRIISIIVRDASGKLAIVADKQPIECGDNYEGILQHMDAHRRKDAQTVLVLLEDDSLAHHWTKPPEPVIETAVAAVDVADASGKKRDRKKR